MKDLQCTPTRHLDTVLAISWDSDYTCELISQQKTIYIYLHSITKVRSLHKLCLSVYLKTTLYCPQETSSALRRDIWTLFWPSTETVNYQSEVSTQTMPTCVYLMTTMLWPCLHQCFIVVFAQIHSKHLPI